MSLRVWVWVWVWVWVCVCVWQREWWLDLTANAINTRQVKNEDPSCDLWRQYELIPISPGTPEWLPPRSVSSPPLRTQRSSPSHWWDARRRGREERVRERKQKATGEEEKQANRRTYELQMIVQNTHYLCVASLLPSGTRSGNSQNKQRKREKGERERERGTAI